MAKYIIGIDPGLKGGIALIDVDAQTLAACPAPVFQEIINRKKKAQYDIHAMADILDIDPALVVSVYIEHVNAMPGQGVTSMFRFGFGYGLWQGIIVAKRLPFRKIMPRTWKAKYGLSRDKAASFSKASELFPRCERFWRLKKHEGLAEAALIAHYGAVDSGFNLTNLTPLQDTKKKQVLLG